MTTLKTAASRGSSKWGRDWEFTTYLKGHPMHTHRAALVAYWEVMCDPISDDYTPDEIGAADLLDLWRQQVEGRYPHNEIPIIWFAMTPRDPDYTRAHGSLLLTRMPFQTPQVALPKWDPTSRGFVQPREGEPAGTGDWFSHFDWPKDPATGEYLNWLRLPVVNKCWNRRRADKGGFIQEATGWKPAILQPTVYLGSLLQRRGE